MLNLPDWLNPAKVPRDIRHIVLHRRAALRDRAKPPVNGAKECARRRKQMGTGEFAPTVPGRAPC